MNSKEIVLQQVQKLCSMRSANGLLEILANEICPLCVRMVAVAILMLASALIVGKSGLNLN